MKIEILDLGINNLKSVVNAFQENLSVSDSLTIVTDSSESLGPDLLVLPGLGSFEAGMQEVEKRNFDKLIRQSQEDGVRLVGICLGMQLLGTRGSEDGDSTGLGLIPATIDRFSSEEVAGAKIPHTGFNLVHSSPDARLFSGLPRSADFYFVHSYRMLSNGLPGLKSTTSYGIDFMSAYEHDNVFATQFHPEKSQSNGLLLLRNFVTQ
jgi:glutamine amidotransferase